MQRIVEDGLGRPGFRIFGETNAFKVSLGKI
jgi:hypothetical protein